MTTLKLDTLSDRIKAHKNALVHIVKPPVCTERAQHYTEMYQQHLDKPIPVRRALALAHHLANRTIWILSLIHISEPTRREWLSRMPSSA